MGCIATSGTQHEADAEIVIGASRVYYCRRCGGTTMADTRLLTAACHKDPTAPLTINVDAAALRRAGVHLPGAGHQTLQDGTQCLRCHLNEQSSFYRLDCVPIDATHSISHRRGVCRQCNYAIANKALSKPCTGGPRSTPSGTPNGTPRGSLRRAPSESLNLKGAGVKRTPSSGSGTPNPLMVVTDAFPPVLWTPEDGT